MHLAEVMVHALLVVISKGAHPYAEPGAEAGVPVGRDPERVAGVSRVALPPH